MTKIAFLFASKFHGTVVFRGTVASDKGDSITIKKMSLKAPSLAGFTWWPDADGAPEGQVRFNASAIFKGDFEFDDIQLTFVIETHGKTETYEMDAEEILRRVVQAAYTVNDTWMRLIDEEKPARMLDIGGRARSGTSRKGLFPGVDVQVADIVDAPDVDHVADVHNLSKHVPGPYNAFMSIATFEHLLMPWKAAIEINKILSPGGFGLVVTHQTVAMHELPWDFFRFSADSFSALFNKKTGFEIVDSGHAIPVSVVPRKWQRQFDKTENAVGFMTSAVVVRKIGKPSVKWDVNTQDVIGTVYPH